MGNCKGCGHKKKTGNTRTSCIACVQTQVGCAEVLIDFMSNGSSRYMTRAVGNLYLAEDEAQDWQDLHNLIRESRINYQTKLIMPDWKVLNKMIVDILIKETT